MSRFGTANTGISFIIARVPCQLCHGTRRTNERTTKIFTTAVIVVVVAIIVLATTTTPTSTAKDRTNSVNFANGLSCLTESIDKPTRKEHTRNSLGRGQAPDQDQSFLLGIVLVGKVTIVNGFFFGQDDTQKGGNDNVQAHDGRHNVKSIPSRRRWSRLTPTRQLSPTGNLSHLEGGTKEGTPQMGMAYSVF